MRLIVDDKLYIMPFIIQVIIAKIKKRNNILTSGKTTNIMAGGRVDRGLMQECKSSYAMLAVLVLQILYMEHG